MTEPTFPAGFVWGAATASFLVEGALDQDGRGVAEDAAAQVSGFMFHDRAPVRYNEQAYDTAVQDAVMRDFEKLSGLRLPGKAPSAAGS
jgi:beta-glucosidase/6-phospho-beta-glucosidase/beta-galactosidase